MTNELEKLFFDAFGIEPKYESHSCDGWGRTVEVKYFTDKKEADKFGMVFSEPKYPQITDRILLELMFILTTLLDTSVYEDVFVTVAKNREELKKDIFEECMLYKQHIKHQVRTLFEEG